MTEKTRVDTRIVDPRENHLPAALPNSEYDRLAPALEPVRLPRPTELEGANEEARAWTFAIVLGVVVLGLSVAVGVFIQFQPRT